jgi:hypothetical protein
MENNNEMNFAEQAFASFESQEVSVLPFEQLAPGWHDVEVKMCIITTDFMKGLRNPTPKPLNERPVWKDATVQLAVYFEGENHKGATRRFSRFGYFKMDELLKANAEMAAKCTKEGDQGYAVLIDKKVRVQSEEATNSAGLILNRFLTAAGIPAGTPGTEICKAVLGKKLKVQVTEHIYNKEKYFDVANFVTIDTPEAELNRVPQAKVKEVEEIAIVPETA